jgi:hypothetical protein
MYQLNRYTISATIQLNAGTPVPLTFTQKLQSFITRNINNNGFNLTYISQKFNDSTQVMIDSLTVMSATNISQIFNYTSTPKTAWMVNVTATFQYYDKTDFTQITPGMFSNGSYVAYAQAHTGTAGVLEPLVTGILGAAGATNSTAAKRLFLTVTN